MSEGMVTRQEGKETAGRGEGGEERKRYSRKREKKIFGRQTARGNKMEWWGRYGHRRERF